MTLTLKCFPALDELEETDFGSKEEDKTECDELPRSLEVENIDIFFAIFSIVSYVLDFITDTALAISLIISGNNLQGALILFFAIVPQCIINVISLHWIYEDGDKVDVGLQRRINAQDSRKKSNKCPCAAFPNEGVISTIFRFFFQAGPLWWYTKYIRNALLVRSAKDAKSRKAHFIRMVEAERDAAMLRFLEAMLESLPQLLIQFTLFSYNIWDKWSTREFRVNYSFLISSSVSLLSISWSFAAQHRSSRMANPNKINVHPIEMLLIVIWRFFTVLSRTILLILGFMYFRLYFFIFVVIHVLISAYHIVSMQWSHFGPGLQSVKYSLVCLTAVIHLFFPFNLSDGGTFHRYFTAYSIEFLEGGLIFFVILRNYTFTFPFKIEYVSISSGTFLIGIFLMIFYYVKVHPNRRRAQRAMVKEQDNDEDPKQLEGGRENAAIDNEPATKSTAN
ncbi:hypothetical protein WR25_04298 [Diploscapter pachys]|uniref:XK-related protein n=1 Tax=Diploscapter pachys TaxID=2018661 RepID=A0A2A2LEI5_9BILA|nr:hypothetical protein WR25_04298 [Diploscapter pachys]